MLLSPMTSKSSHSTKHILSIQHTDIISNYLAYTSSKLCQLCRFSPCQQGSAICKFIHIDALPCSADGSVFCKHGVDISRVQCPHFIRSVDPLSNKSTTPCRNGISCRYIGCIYQHPKSSIPTQSKRQRDKRDISPAPIDTSIRCRHGINCKYIGCIFQHPPGYDASKCCLNISSKHRHISSTGISDSQPTNHINEPNTTIEPIPVVLNDEPDTTVEPIPVVLTDVPYSTIDPVVLTDIPDSTIVPVVLTDVPVLINRRYINVDDSVFSV